MSMEKLKIHSNGQWILEKAKPSLKEVRHAYHATKMKDGDFFSGEDKDRAEKSVLDMVDRLHHKPLKDIDGVPHVLTHRGVKDIDNKEGPNKIKVDGNFISQSHNAVHSLDPLSAHEYGDVHSFWVPVSSFVSSVNHLNSRYQDDSQEMPKSGLNQHTKVGAGNKYNSETEARRDLGYDPHAEKEKHVIVKPGKYPRATSDELTQMNERGIENWKNSNDENRYVPIMHSYINYSTPNGNVSGKDTKGFHKQNGNIVENTGTINLRKPSAA